MIAFEPSKHTSFDVVIIGGGPGGLSAATWCAELGLSALLIESSSELGGQLLWIHNPIDNHLGGRYENGKSMRDSLLVQLDLREFVCALGVKVTKIDAEKNEVVLSDQTHISFRYVIVATGLSRRRLGIANELEFTGRGILESGAGQRESVKGKSVAVVGGGDAAVENAAILSEHAAKVYLIHRRDRFAARKEMSESIEGRSNVEMMINKSVKSINGSDELESISLLDTLDGTETELEIDTLLIRIGFAPNTLLIKDLVEVDGNGYIRTDSTFATTNKSIYAIGDVACPIAPTISGAIGAGSMAAKAIYSKLNLE